MSKYAHLVRIRIARLDSRNSDKWDGLRAGRQFVTISG
jgi:hypothetical protein